MSIRPLGAGDRGAAVALWTATGLVRPWNDPASDFDRAVAGTGSTVLGLSDGSGALLGTAMAGDDGHRGWIYYLAVADAHRGRGHGRALVAAAERWLAARGVPKVQLMVRADNAAAGDFYRALGYQASDVAVLSRRLA